MDNKTDYKSINNMVIADGAVEKFLIQFHFSESIEDALSSKCSYWFAAVLFGRFIRDGAKIMFSETPTKFGTYIKGKVYDITGDVTDNYHWVPWESIVDNPYRETVIRNYIMF